MSNTRVYDVPGISCDHCVRAISSELENVIGVTSFDVDVDDKSVTVTGGADRDIIEAIDDAGYDATVR
jgi:copper chaperone